MRDWIGKRLEAQAKRQEARDDEFAALMNKAVDAAAHRPTHWYMLAVLGSVNCLIWLSILLFPLDVYEAWTIVSGLNDRITAMVIAIIFGIGLWLTYLLLRLRYQDVEEQDLTSEVFASVSYHSRASRRFLVWLFSVAGGLINLVALILVEVALIGN